MTAKSESATVSIPRWVIVSIIPSTLGAVIGFGAWGMGEIRGAIRDNTEAVTTSQKDLKGSIDELAGVVSALDKDAHLEISELSGKVDKETAALDARLKVCESRKGCKGIR